MSRKTDSNNPDDWLHIAASDLAGIKKLIAWELSYPLCVSKLAEILEKIIKAELIRTGWFLAKTHDLVKLVDELRERDNGLADDIQHLSEELAERYFTDRYPGFDLEDEDWPTITRQANEIEILLNIVKNRLVSSKHY